MYRLGVEVGRSKEKQEIWGFILDEDTYCHCEQAQTMIHLINCPTCSTSCTKDDIMSVTKEGIEIASFWQERICHTTANIIILRYQTKLTPNELYNVISNIIYFLFN